MREANTEYTKMTDSAIVAHVGSFIKHLRVKQNKTQTQLAEMSGLNRWTIGQIEKGESITLASLIQILRALDSFYALDGFNYSNEISPLEYVKLRKNEAKKRVRNKSTSKEEKEDLGW
jgi:transcriptional regulator with XRE-family HTH domain